jgi:tartrate dehydratase alpha subunit/fumarate hydratase class I-like protein
MFNEKNTGTNLPAQIDIFAENGSSYDFLFVAKGGGSANKTFLFQQTKALLNKDKLMQFINEKIKTLGTGGYRFLFERKIEIIFLFILSCLVNYFGFYV